MGVITAFSCNVSRLLAASNKDPALSSAGQSTMSLLSPLSLIFTKLAGIGSCTLLLNLLGIGRWGWCGELQSR